MRQQTVVLRPSHFSIKPKSITEFWDRIGNVMKRVEKRAFQLFEERGRENGHDQEDWFRAEAEQLTPVSIKIYQAHNELRILAQVPGFEADDMAFNLEKNLLTIQGAKQVQTGKVTDRTEYSESQAKMIYHTVTLPSEVIPEKAAATLKNGVLEIVVPKAVVEPAKSVAASAA